MGTAPSLAAPLAFEGPFLTDSEALTAASGSTGPVTMRPAAVAVPSTLADAVALVGTAQARGWTLTPRGGATGMPGGNVGPGVAVDMTPGFQAVELIDSDRMIARAGVGVTMSAINEAARPFGLELPPLPSSAHRCTLGGVLANNAAGPRSFLHGSIRPWVAAIEAVLADGTVIELGAEAPQPLMNTLRESLLAAGDWRSEWPRVRKNSSGYALPEFLDSGRIQDLLVGSEGTLSVFTRADIRLRPLPELRRLHAVRIPTMEHLPEITAAALEVGASTCEFLGDRLLQLGELEADPLVGDLARGSWGLALVEMEGTVDQVTVASEGLEREWIRSGLSHRSSESQEAMEALWGVRRRASPTIARNAGAGRTSVQFIEDGVVPPATLPAYLRGLGGILDEAGLDAVIFGHAGDANVHVNPLVPMGTPGWEDRVRTVLFSVADLIASLGGTLSGEHGDGRIRAPVLDRVWSAAAMRGFRLVKDTLDPDGVLNPGVILPLPGQDPLEGFGTP